MRHTRFEPHATPRPLPLETCPHDTHAGGSPYKCGYTRGTRQGGARRLCGCPQRRQTRSQCGR
eukprot:3828402-Prymnesium_polylepis.1